MKSLLLLFTLVTLSSCKKDEPAYEPGFGFEANGVSYGWDFFNRPNLERQDVYFLRITSPNTLQPKFQLIGVNEDKNISVELAMQTPVIEVAQYRSTLTYADPYLESFFYLNGEEYAAHTGDEVIVNITGIRGNLASGYFRAVMHDRRTQLNKVDILKGYFKDVEIPQ